MKALINLASQKLVLVTQSYFEAHDTYSWVECDPTVCVTTHRWNGSSIVPLPAGEVPSWWVLKGTVRARMGVLGSALDGLPPWWGDAAAIRSDDADMTTVLVGLDLDPARVLARDPQATKMFKQ